MTKKNKSNKSNKTKKAKGPSARKKKNSGGGSQGHIGMAMQVCSITNPFCPEAKGARWPDNSYTKSAGLPIEAATILSTDANGALGYLFGPTLDSQFAAGTVTAGVAAYTSFTALSGISPFSGVSRYRVTSYGLKLQCTSTQMNTTGRVRIRLLSPLTGASLASVALNTPYADAMLDVPLSRLISQDVYVNLAPLGDNARIFQPYITPGITMANWVNPGWQVAQIGVDGGQVSTQCLCVTWYYNYEVIFDDASTNQLFATAPPLSSPKAQEVSAGVMARVGNFIEGTAQRVDSLFSSAAMKYIGAGVASYFGGPAAGSKVYGALASRNLRV